MEQATLSVVRITRDSSTGTGFIYEVDGDTAYVLTNEHVVADAAQVMVEVEGTDYAGVVLGVDPRQDVAVLQVCCDSFHALKWRLQNDVTAGQEVMVIGYALGLPGPPTVTRGIVSALRATKWDVDVIQIDAPINEGNSGGPVLAQDGSVMGMVTFKFTASEGLGFAMTGLAVRQRAPALVNADVIDYKGRRFLRAAGPADVHEGSPSYIVAENFAAEVEVADGRPATFRVMQRDGKEPLSETLRIHEISGCEHSTRSTDDQITSKDVPATGGRLITKDARRIRLVVLDGTAEAFVDDKLACTTPWRFGRAGMVVLAGGWPPDDRVSHDFGVWVAD